MILDMCIIAAFFFLGSTTHMHGDTFTINISQMTMKDVAVYDTWSKMLMLLCIIEFWIAGVACFYPYSSASYVLCV